MSRFQRICVGWDAFARDGAITGQIRELATWNQAHLELVHVMSDHSQGSWPDAHHERWQGIVRDDRRRRLETAAEALRKDGLSVRCEVLAGHPHIELIRHLHRKRCDLLYIVDEPMGRQQERSFGPTTQKLLRKCPAPVWAARLGAAGQPKRIAVALDLRPSGEEAEGPNEQILDACRRITAPSTEVSLIHVWNVWGESLLRSRLSDAENGQMMEQAEKEHREALERWVARFRDAGIQTTPVLEHGDVRTMLPRMVERIGPDVLVMGTVCRTGLPGFIIGNTAERIINSLSCSILTVKPAAFVSPVPLED